ncbi:hypothetical protein GT348_05840 [Aristophania vespae]|uniref:NADH:ubiquinone oxidoreductase-like 20kDa subunit domain-containing protein n=1 Tax=Aristophania vespae TaxID=2697033 RepID=A0A6P1NE88_9PROT|nr:hypothetical protein [Aristophania vespae]QHI95829.1 hypothetical protein GT348_05840 [Aristophania vespae]
MSKHSAPVTWLFAFWETRQNRPALKKRVRAPRPIRLFSLETGSCEGCAMEIASLAGGAYSLKASGFEMVSNPGEADWLLVTGAVTRSNAGALLEAWQAMADHKILVAIGACALNGGPFTAPYTSLGGVEKISRFYHPIAGCPPSPEELRQALLVLADKVSSSFSAS